MNDLYFFPVDASRAAVRHWLSLQDRTGLVPVVMEAGGNAFSADVWPRASLDELPEGAWVVYDRALPPAA